MKRLAIAVALLIGLATPSQADYLDGLRAYRLGDYATALQEFKPLANQGFARAQSNLGIMYLIGRGVPQDYVQAHMWYNLAASRFPSSKDRDRAINGRDNVAEKMAPAQIAEAKRLAREWTAKHNR